MQGKEVNENIGNREVDEKKGKGRRVEERNEKEVDVKKGKGKKVDERKR